MKSVATGGRNDDTKLMQEGPGGTNPGASGSRLFNGEIGKLDTLSTLLTREGFDGVALTVSSALGELVDPRTIRPGEKYTLAFDEEGAPESFEPSVVPESARRLSKRGYISPAAYQN